MKTPNLKRNCPKCGTELEYKNIISFNRAENNKSLCTRCTAKCRKPRSQETNSIIAWNKIGEENKKIILSHPDLTKKCPKWNEDVKFSSMITLVRSVKKNLICRKCAVNNAYSSGKLIPWNKDKIMSEEFRKKIKKSWKKTKSSRSGGNHYFYGTSGPMSGRKHSQSTRSKMRSSMIFNLQNKYFNGKFCPNYNKTACRWFGEFSKKYKIDIQHAENGGEYSDLGYFADGFIKTINVWIEYDENKHYVGGKLRDRDLIKNKSIISKNYKLVRIKECKNFEEFETLLKTATLNIL